MKGLLSLAYCMRDFLVEIRFELCPTTFVLRTRLRGDLMLDFRSDLKELVARDGLSTVRALFRPGFSDRLSPPTL